MTNFWLLLGRVWRLTKDYWTSEERKLASALLASIILLNFGLVYVNVLLNTVNGELFNALQQQDQGAFYAAFIDIMALIGLYLAVALLRYYLNQTLQIRWRRWLNARYIGRWIDNGIFYRMRFASRVDNPDQRIADDIRLFIEQTLSLGLGLLNSLATLGSFAIILWNLSGSITIPIGGSEIVIPGYMFWVAVLYSGLGSVAAHLIGRPLIRLGNRQQALEADYRFGLVRVREEAEGIALYRGEARERASALARFAAVYDNFIRLIHCNVRYLTFQVFIGQLAAFFPLLVASPRYFSGAIQLGGLTQTANAFGQVNDALSWFINSYQTFADWRATVDRLTEFSDDLAREAAAVGQGAQVEPTSGPEIALDQVAVALPDGRPLLQPIALTVAAGERVLLRGASGSGKSTVFRMLAGLWPFAAGRLRLPRGARTLFLPQRPYIPIASLREALWYPEATPGGRDDDAIAALAAVGLGHLAGRLDEVAHWTYRLSGGEQQRLALARALLIMPDWLFLDEATAATDEVNEAALYRTLIERLPRTAIVSIGHRRSLEALHQRVLTIEPGAPGRLVPA